MVGVGIIGCGGMAFGNAQNLLKAASDNVEIRALYDPEPGKYEKFQQNLNPEAKGCDSYEEVVTDPNVDWVMIASLNSYHADQAVAALNEGKHVFCQKPLATNLQDCKKMYDAWKQSNSLFNLGFTLRYSPHYRRVQELVQAGEVGDIISMEFNETLGFNHGGMIHRNWRRLQKYAGTHLLEKCCHDMDLVNWITGSTPQRVGSFGGRNFFTPENVHHIERIGQNDEGKYAYCGNMDPEEMNPFTCDKDIVDNQVAILEYENGVRCTFHTNCNAGIPERRMYILGTEGAIRAAVRAGTIEVQRIGFDTSIRDESVDMKGSHAGGDAVMGRELAESMVDNAPPAVGFEEGLRSAVVCFAIDDAREQGKIVDVSPYYQEVGLKN